MGSSCNVCDPSIPSTKIIQRQVARVNATLKDQDLKKRLKNVDLFVLDNSIRESTVGALRGHTVQNKWKIYDVSKKCGFKHLIVATFTYQTQIDDIFVQEIREKTNDFENYFLYAFSEVCTGVKDGRMVIDSLPVGLKKIRQFKMQNVILELDLSKANVDWEGKFTAVDLGKMVLDWIKWTRKQLSAKSRVFVNFRDFPVTMEFNPTRGLTFINYLAELPEEYRPAGLMFEEPSGKYFPYQLGAWTRAARKVMHARGWEGKLLVHVHEKWGYSDSVQLQCIANGADGVWCSLCEEGAASGHASSTLTILNLIRTGNTQVLRKFNCNYLREASIKVTEITTGKTPDPKTPIVGERCLDLVFDCMKTGADYDLNLAKFFKTEAPFRISSLASNNYIISRLIQLFGENPQFNNAMAETMKLEMQKDLQEGRKEEYMSAVGLCVLFAQSGGKLTKEMADIVANDHINTPQGKMMIREVRKIWDDWDSRQVKKKDNKLQFTSFYNAFMITYFGCFACDDTRDGLAAIDMDDDGMICWLEFELYLKWALNQYAEEIEDIEQLLSIAFVRGIIPAMRDCAQRKRY